MVLFLGFIIFKQLSTRPPKSAHGFRPLADGFHSHGIDISHYQGKVDWNVLFQHSDSLVSFVFCKATEGTSYLDPTWNENLKALRDRKIPVGAYHFFKPNISAKKQAEHFLKHYKAEPNDLPAVIDVEEEIKSKSELRENVKIWMDLVEEATGTRPIIYTSYSMFTTIFQNDFKTEQFWIANYSNHPERFKDPRILYWQYSDQGQLPGIESRVDLNMSKIKF